MNTKKYIYTFLVIGALCGGCTQWVDYSPKDDYKVTDADYLKSETDYRSMGVSVYTPIQWLNQVVPIGDIASDNAVAGGENASDVLSLQQIDDFLVNSQNGTLTEIWKAAYEGINRANYLYQYKDTNPSGEAVNFTGKDALYGEVAFLRAYYYFTLVKVFGNVPLFVDKKLGIADSRTLKQAKPTEIYAQIEKDLTNAIAVLPTTDPKNGRITKYAAQALLGKVYLYQNKFDAAAPVLKSVVDGPYTLVSNFGNIFLQSGENGSEAVFEIQYSNASPYYNWGGTTRGQGNYAVQQCGIRGLTGNSPYAAGWSTNLPTQDLANAYEAGDTRKAVTCLDIEAYKAANPSMNITYQVAPYKNTGLYNQKYLPRKGESSGQIELNYLNNQRIIRLSDVYLMYAEALNRKASPDDATALVYLNKVRQRAFGDNNHNLSATGTSLRDAIWKERRLELGMEGDRFFDLVRTDQAATKLTGFKVGKNEIFPIPQVEIEVSGLVQNPGY
ncbi:RagB/SusD family nutrient uptake outer membrane protein [Flectobacillus sp. DC10W]|uniref:RagB/SusD family nutrient uptake outer membrane protein n=1 Tax=Flectobacillus longus TaxID=2984207 RepID=A0ABT6YJR6_9BACT|nr:RagB/SusD family nutrient uptake outer membrane protein [Flectobacillus longus]MDI9863770.1 RagB/SusD family nutrient uptake outer membrane protein [Flectobacillus longus]